MLGKRVATAIVLLAILLPAIFLFSPVVWGVVSLVFLCAAGWEWARLLGRSSQAWPLAIFLAILGGMALYWRAAHEWPSMVPGAIAACLTLFWICAGPWRLRHHDARSGGVALAALILAGAWLALFELRERSIQMLISSMALVWIADIAAYFVGRAFGRRKLAPAISPGKSWEGAIGGALCVVIVGIGVAQVPALSDTLSARLFASMPGLFAALLLIGLSALSVVGDLHESLLKRQASMKDSSGLLPGHGGVLDRIDALLPVMPAALLLSLWLS